MPCMPLVCVFSVWAHLGGAGEGDVHLAVQLPWLAAVADVHSGVALHGGPLVAMRR